jgi:SNF2 family DNA or RNA helicase
LPALRTLLKERSLNIGETRLTQFLDEASPLMEHLGVQVAYPKTLRRALKPRLVLAADMAHGDDDGADLVRNNVTYLQLDRLLEWRWTVAIGDKTFSLEEFRQLAAEKAGVVRFHDLFVAIEPEELAMLLRTAGPAAPKPAAADFLRAYCSGDAVLSSVDAEAVMAKLLSPRDFDLPRTLCATLRPYQERGVRWMLSLLFSGFGAILADDMGLGKTVQTIAVIQHLQETGSLPRRALVIAPASLLENWERELSRFAPALAVTRYHGPGRYLAPAANVYLTTYHTAVRDNDVLRAQEFSLIVTDEAHLLKNAATQVSRAVKLLRTHRRLALSGTPVENRLEDLRSLFDFIIPGYLGASKDFQETWRKPIEVFKNRETADRLKKAIAPFLLRRLKTDKAIIKDLPAKVIVTHYPALGKEQAALYENVVASALGKSKAMKDTAARSGLILGLITALKQICDHPRVYDKESPAVAALSGKARLLVTLVGEILAGGEKVLIFSQYVETLTVLAAVLAAETGEAPLIYHGGLDQTARAAVVDRFQTDRAARILLLSLRAGGLGLNLTAASAVIHFDLWYNPAVEAQATDRAFRIGQKRTVFVHRFVTKGSFEEKIDAMLADKQSLADLTVTAGETYLARMTHDELVDLFTPL